VITIQISEAVAETEVGSEGHEVVLEEEVVQEVVHVEGQKW
jgi:hypothetical protein